MARRITATVSMFGVDDESDSTNENATMDHTESVVLDQQFAPAQLIESAMKWGGELRAELDLNCQLVNSPGAIVVRGHGRLFEGTSEETGDLAGEERFNIFVGPNATESITITIYNTADPAPDYVIMNVTLANTAAESL